MTRLSPAGLGLLAALAALAGGAVALPWFAATAQTDETTTAWPTGIPAAALADVDACLDRGGPVDRSAAACDRAATMSSGLGSPLEAALLYRRGQLALGRGQLPEAVALLAAARRLEPTVAPYALTLGDALAAGGERERAALVYREGQALAPSAEVFAARLQALQQPPSAAALAETVP